MPIILIMRSHFFLQNSVFLTVILASSPSAFPLQPIILLCQSNTLKSFWRGSSPWVWGPFSLQGADFIRQDRLRAQSENPMQSCCSLPWQSQGKPQGAHLLKQEHLVSCQGVHGFLHTPAWYSGFSLKGRSWQPCPCDCLLALAPCVEGTTWTAPCLLSSIHYMTLGSAGPGAQVQIPWCQSVVGQLWLQSQAHPLPPPECRGEWISARCDEASAAAGFLLGCICLIFSSDYCHSSHFIKIKSVKICSYC